MNDVGDSAADERLSSPITLSVVIPAYNEALRLERTLDATAGFLESRGETYEIIVVDDGSSDSTSAVAANWGARRRLDSGSLRVLSYEANRGKGYAVRYGILRAQGKHILFMDADLATPIEELAKLELAIGRSRKPEDEPAVQFAIGSRDVKSSQLLVRQPLYREAAGRLFNKIVQLLATPGIHGLLRRTFSSTAPWMDFHLMSRLFLSHDV
jgi:dolichyl-phosphate beta-glucosyltransferase